MARRQYLQPGDWLYLDNLAAHKTTAVLREARALGIKLVFFPPHTSPDLSPCDNRFFAQFKLEYGKQRAAGVEKMRAADLAFASISPDTVKRYWISCGLLRPNVQPQDDEDTD
jgi:hypothetical protein